MTLRSGVRVSWEVRVEETYPDGIDVYPPISVKGFGSTPEEALRNLREHALSERDAAEETYQAALQVEA